MGWEFDSPTGDLRMSELKKTLEERFWEKVNKTDRCWEWTACLNEHGYGIISIKHWPNKASRVSWRLAYGEIPNGLFVLHHCDNPKCIRPDHLFLGTSHDNKLDQMGKGRFIPNNEDKRGEGNWISRLDSVSVLEIRQMYLGGTYSQQELADIYKVGKST